MFLVKREELRSFKVFLSVSLCVFCVWERAKMCRKTRQSVKLKKIMIHFLVWGVPRAFYSFDASFKAKGRQPQTSSDWVILKPLEKSWLLVFEKVWNLKIQRSNQKLWLSEISGASIDASSWFSWYLGYSNFDFDPWIVVGMIIW